MHAYTNRHTYIKSNIHTYTLIHTYVRIYIHTSAHTHNNIHEAFFPITDMLKNCQCSGRKALTLIRTYRV